MSDNKDLAANANDPERLRLQYPKIAEYLHWPELVEEFTKHDALALAQKGTTRRSATATVLLYVLSAGFLQIAGSPLIDSNSVFPMILITLAALFFFAALYIMSGIPKGHQKDAWLYHRLIAERLRQLHFQFLLFHAGRVVSTSVSDRASVMRERKAALSRVIDRLEDRGYINSVIDDSGLAQSDLLDMHRAAFADVDTDALKELTLFWETERFGRQVAYTDKQTFMGANKLKFRDGTPAERNRTTEAIEWGALFLIIVLQFFSVITFGALLFGNLFSTTASQILTYGVAQLTLLLITLLALLNAGVQTYRDGLLLPPDVSRNRVYGSYCTKLSRKFNEVVAEGDLTGQLRVMREMEDLAYFETREFIIQHSKSRFSF